MAELELNKIVEEAKNHPGITTVLTTSAAGAAIGSVLPIVGTTIGLGIGAIIGGVGIIANEIRKEK